MENGSKWLAEKLRKGQIWCALLALSLSLSAASWVDSQGRPTGREPVSLEDRALDPSVAHPGDIVDDLRLSGPFYLTLGASFLGLFLVLSLFNGRIEVGAADDLDDREKSGILIFSQLALALYVLELTAATADARDLRTLLHLFCGLFLFAMWAKRAVAVRMKGAKGLLTIWSLLNDDQLAAAGLVLSAAVIGSLALVQGGIQPIFGGSVAMAFTFYLATLLLLFVVYSSIAQTTVSRSIGSRVLVLYDLSATTIVAAAPLVLMPLAMQIASELQFSYPRLGLGAWVILAVGTLVIAAVVLAVLQGRKAITISPATILHGFYFPATVVTFASLKTHQLLLDLGRLDYLGAGQQTLPAQQWLEFGSVPVLDLLPSQGLSDFGFPFLFGLLNGVQGLDMIIWLPWLPTVFGFLSIYAFLALVTSPVLALLVTLLMPVQAVVVGPYAMMLVPAMMLVIVLRSPSFSRFLVLWMVSAALLLWRPGLGAPAALALVAIVTWVVLVEKRELWLPATGSLALVLGLVPVSLLVGEVIGDSDTQAALMNFINLLGDSPAVDAGFREIGTGSLGLAALLQGVLPILAVTGALFFCLREVLSPNSFGASAHAVLFVTVFSLMLPARLESGGGDRLFFDPSLLFLTLVLFPFLVIDGGFRIRQVGRSAWLLLSLVGCALVGSVGIYSLVGGIGEYDSLQPWQPESRRVLFDRQPHQDLVEYLKTELGEGESFLDFTGSTALYVLAGKRYPLPTITDFRVTSESVQQTQIELLENQRLTGGLPLVLFRAPQGTTRDKGVLPTEATSYRIAEFIYAQYFPFTRIAGWEIWREKGGRRGKPAAPAKMIGPKSIRQEFRLGLLPRRWALEDPWESILHDEVASLLELPTVVRARSPLRLQWEPSTGMPAVTYLHVKARPLRGAFVARKDESEPELQVLYGHEPQSSFSLRFGTESSLDLDRGRSFPLELQASFKKNLLHRVAKYPDRWIFRTTGKDPWIRRFLDLSQVPALQVGTEQWIRIEYRSTRPGKGQVFFSAKEKQFLERNSVRVSMVGTGIDGVPAEVVVPVLGIETGGRLVSLRLDPPVDSEFEIVAAELVEVTASGDDHLIRLTTQFQWVSQEPTSLTLQSNAPILVDSVVFRTGD